jgi:hypothetical protein
MSSAGDLLVGFGWTPRRQRSVYAACHLNPAMRLGALLSSDNFGSSVERKAHGQVLCRALVWLYEWT